MGRALDAHKICELSSCALGVAAGADVPEERDQEMFEYAGVAFSVGLRAPAHQLRRRLELFDLGLVQRHGGGTLPTPPGTV